MLRTRSLIVYVLVLLTLVVVVPGWSRAEDEADRERRAKAAIAVAKALAKEPAVIAKAPAPHVPEPKSYADGTKESLIDGSPLVVYVSCTGPKIDGAITCEVAGPTFGSVTGPAVVVGYPQGGRLLIESTLPCTAKVGEIEAAVKNAAKKIDTPPKRMPATAPLPLNTQIRSGCICGDGCQCAAGKCPGGCPVATKPALATVAAPTQTLVGYTRVCNNGVCQLVPVYR